MTATITIMIEEVHGIGGPAQGFFVSTSRRSSTASNPEERQEGWLFHLCSSGVTTAGSRFFLFSSCRAWALAKLLLLVGMTITSTLLGGGGHSHRGWILDSCSSVGKAVHDGNIVMR